MIIDNYFPKVLCFLTISPRLVGIKATPHKANECHPKRMIPTAVSTANKHTSDRKADFAAGTASRLSPAVRSSELQCHSGAARSVPAGSRRQKAHCGKLPRRPVWHRAAGCTSPVPDAAFRKPISPQKRCPQQQIHCRTCKRNQYVLPVCPAGSRRHKQRSGTAQ